jgi:hypothetical protein
MRDIEMTQFFETGNNNSEIDYMGPFKNIAVISW